MSTQSIQGQTKFLEKFLIGTFQVSSMVFGITLLFDMAPTTEFLLGKNEVTWNERFDIGVRSYKNGKM